MSGREWCTLEEWLQCRRPLCPLVVRHDGRVEQPSDTSGNIRNATGEIGIRVCFASRRIGGSFLDDGASQECAAFSSHPELLSLLPYVESLEDNEAITASGLCTYSIIHDLKNKAVFDPGATTTTTTTTTTQSSTTTATLQQTSTPMCLIDAEDYSDLPVRQYEEDNVLRELNKAYLGFHQVYQDVGKISQQTQMQQRLPPVGASRDSSPSSRQASMNTDHDWTRSTTLVASSGDPSSPRPSLCPSSTSQDQSQSTLDDTDRGRPAPNPTMLYGGGRNVPLTLAKATVVKQLMTSDTDSDLLRLPLSTKRPGSIYASCHSQDDSSVEEFRSANTSLDEDEPTARLPSRLHRPTEDENGQLARSRSDESDSSAENRRPASRGFALDSHNEEDSFSGDGLEREKRWLDHFRERRGPRSRSGLKDSASSSKDSSRYSFSTEFSSELDELYDQFSHWLEDPNSSETGQNGRNAAVFRFAHGLLKRALSDSFASVAMNIENLSAQPETRMKDIKLSASSESRRGSTQRSWSLAEHVGDERLALQLAKEMVEREVPEEQVLPMPDIVPLVPVAIEEEKAVAEEEPEEVKPAKKSSNRTKVACQLNTQLPERVVLLDRMSPVESEGGSELLEFHRQDGQLVARCCEAISESNRSSNAGEDSESQTPTPMNPTPPRTRRGSWFFKKSREQRHHPSIKHQRARSNSVPTVMELSQLSLWQQQMAEQLKQSLIPDIIVSDENTEDDECFTNSPQQSQRRHRSYDDQLQNFAQSSESLLSDDVVEGFSWTMAETIIEDIMKEIGSKQTQLTLPARQSGGVGKSGFQNPAKVTNKLPGKSILKICSNDSLNRSHSGSLEQHPDSAERPAYVAHKSVAEHMAEQQHQNSPMSWSHRSTSMPSLRAIDELESLNASLADESDSGQMTNGNRTEGEKQFRQVNGGLLPIITGNWGCGSSGGGDAQLKSMLQWMAASRSGAPSLIYYTAGASSVVKLDIVCRIIMDRQWTVGDLASAVLRYCRARLDPRRLDLISRLETHYQAVMDGSCGDISLSSSECSGSHSGTDRLLFDELLGQYPLKQTEL